MRWNLHNVIIEGISQDATLRQSWKATFASLPSSQDAPDLVCHLDLVNTVPDPPPRSPDFTQGDLLQYYVDEQRIIAHFPRFGQLRLDLDQATTHGQLVAAALNTYGVLEDLIAIGLSPHLRRSDLYLIHAFAAVYRERAVLLVGGIGAGKTTTGMSLLNAGWKLLSNDSPIVTQQDAVPTIGQYPGMLAGYPETFARFPVTQAHVPESKLAGRRKLILPAEAIWPAVWCQSAPIGAILFPQIAARSDHELEPIAPLAALARLMPHAMEQWDQPMIPRHLTMLRRLVEAAPAFVLHLGPDVLAIPHFLDQTLTLNQSESPASSLQAQM